MSDTNTLLRTVLIIVAAVLLVPVVLMILFVPMMGMMGWSWSGWGMGNGMTGLSWMGPGLWLLVLLVLAGLGYVLVGRLTATESERRDSAHDELRRAYARGDLTDEEYEERRQRLERESGGQSSR